MGLLIEEQDKECQCKIDGELCIYEISDFKNQLLPFVENNDTLNFDLSTVTEVDSAGLQFLMALKQLRHSPSSKEVHFLSHSQTVLEIIELLDLEAKFGDPIVYASEK